MATWSRRLSSAQAKQPGLTRRSGSDLPDSLPADILAEDQAVLRSIGALAKDRPGFRSRLTVRTGTEQDHQDVDVVVAHDGGAVSYQLAGSAPEPVQPASDVDLEDDFGLSGDRVVEMLTDTLVITPDIVAIFASVGAEALWANDAFATAIPIREADRIWLIDLLDEWSKGHFEVNVLPALVQHGRWHGRLVLQPMPEDPPLPLLTSLVAHRDQSGEIEAIAMVARDLRPLHDAEERMQSGAPGLAGLVEQADDILLVVDAGQRILYASPATTRALGIAEGALDGTTFADRVHPDDRDRVADVRVLAEGDEEGVPPLVELRLLTDDAGWRIVELGAADLTDNAAIAGVVLTARDVTERVEAVQRLADRAYTDPLTLLPNRMRLLDRLGKALQDSEDRSVVVLLFDVDDFAGFNREHGRAMADEALREVGHRLSDETRPDDVVARLSGDTFAMVMRKVTDVDGALVAADRIRSRLVEPYRLGEKTVGVTVSVGIAVSHRGQAADELLSDAGRAVGIAKELGGDRVEVLTAELRNSASRRTGMEDVLRRTLLEGDGVEVHYQPIFDLETGAVTGAEALLRVHDDEGALLNPSSFIDAAEGSGLIGPLGRQVLDLTCRQLVAWRDDGGADVPSQISVNVSPRQLADPGFVDMVADAIEQAGIEPGQLCLEITESTKFGERGIIDDVVAAARAIGVSIGLDDFGAGQSSLGYLKRFALDFVKIDRELVNGVGRDEGDTAIIRATVELAHGLGLTVIAVGVETEDQLEILKLLGVDRAQGFLYSPAVAAADLPDRVRVFSSR